MKKNELYKEFLFIEKNRFYELLEELIKEGLLIESFKAAESP